MQEEKEAPERKKWPLAVVFVIVLGLVSLLADMANEGSRVMTGPFLAALGASAAIVAIISGLSELAGYSLRVVFGWVTDRTGRYWTLTFIGYGINLVAVPALALAGDWPFAVSLMLVERVGRAIRGPARDAMLSHASVDTGRGWAYGVQEALSSVGGMLGPMIVVLIMLIGGNYRMGFLVLAIPALMAMVLLVYAWKINPRPRDMEGSCTKIDTRKRLPSAYWYFVAGAALVAAGYIDFPIISYYLSDTQMVADDLMPILYALAMGADALSALVFGRLYDHKGMGILIVGLLIAPLFVPLIFSGNIALMLVGMVLYGIGFGAQESIMRAIVADMAPYCRRASAFGYYNAVFGIAWFSGSVLIGLLFDLSMPSMIVLAVGLQLSSIPLFMYVRSDSRNWKGRRKAKANHK
ncbi:MAG: putative arabinose transporter [Methanomassiliicoccales archaeon PtaU1.Bin124]|nr:MAG: putative arabinose transporter [Methanomassiliicoccales archaeon PtaU1.Bin124]